MSPVEVVTRYPYTYRAKELLDSDWTRFPGWRDVTAGEWNSAEWQRSHSVKNVRQLRAVVGDLLADAVYDDLTRDQARYANMALLVPPQIINTIAPGAPRSGPGSLTEAFYADPVRRYMIPLASERRIDWPSHPRAQRDPLHERTMWATEGLTHRYPTKVLTELTSTCPQYCGHCTRMDLVGPSVPQITKSHFDGRSSERLEMMVNYIAAQPQIRDVVVSGGDVANVQWPRLEAFVSELLRIDHVRDIRLASKALVGLPQYWLRDDVRAGMARLGDLARRTETNLAMHTHVNAAQSVTPLMARAARAVLSAGFRDVRNQGVLMRGVNDTPEALLDLSFALLDGASVMPYYLYLCDMVPNAEHWRLTLASAQRLQESIMGWLPGFATPRLVCDVPMLGKRWVNQAVSYDVVRGISTWGGVSSVGSAGEMFPGERIFEYFDPIHLLPEQGQRWWREHADAG